MTGKTRRKEIPSQPKIVLSSDQEKTVESSVALSECCSVSASSEEKLIVEKKPNLLPLKTGVGKQGVEGKPQDWNAGESGVQMAESQGHSKLDAVGESAGDSNPAKTDTPGDSGCLIDKPTTAETPNVESGDGLSKKIIDKSKSAISDKPQTKKKETTGKKQRSNKSKKPAVNSMKITDFFEVRRSGRKTESEIKKEKFDVLETAILSEKQDGLEIFEHPVKGRGIKATRIFERGDFVVEYKGETVSKEEGLRRNDEYSNDSSIGSYLYYFECGNKQYCVDATAESKYYGRLINHSAKKPNLVTKALEVRHKPHLILIASRRIEPGEELLYDYGERDSEAISNNPWLKNT